ncbi:MAG TPA: SpoIIE family protein phosphatase [Verrucomicrobiae bacterium]|nr:SpoIIE family protein phosphatase [Verrucomicrobiae bacterium]
MPVLTHPADLHSIERLREQELEEARAIQSVMLPGEPLRSDCVTISHEFQPVAEVGGDYLDYFLLPDGMIGLYLGDVCGKGLPAALYAALAVGTLRGVHKTGQAPAKVLSLLNKRLLLRGITERYTVIQYAIFDSFRAQMRIASAGMLGPLLIRGNECSVMQLAGFPPGLFSGVIYDEFTLNLVPGDSVLFCTDGLTDAQNGHGREFDLGGIQDVCHRHAGDSPTDLLNHVFSAIQEFSKNCAQSDDMTAAVFHYAPSPSGTGLTR